MSTNPNNVKRTYFPPMVMTKQTGENEEARLYWGIRNGYPRLSLSMKQPIVSPTEREFDYKNLIIAPFERITFGVFLKQFTEIIDDEPKTTRTVKCYNVKFKDGVKTDEVYLQGVITLGKDDNGIIYIHMYNDEKNNGDDAIKFELITPHKWNRFFKNDKEINQAILSKQFATEYLKELTKQYHRVFDTDAYVDKEITKDGSSE